MKQKIGNILCIIGKALGAVCSEESTSNLTANYDSLLVQYEQLRTDYDYLILQGLQDKTLWEADLKAAIEENKQWEAQFDILLAETKKDTEEVQLVPYNTIDINTMSSILLDKLDEMGCTGEIYLPDADCKTYTKSSVLDHYALVEISGIDYIAEGHDCDDFAALLFADFAGLVWTNTHALNWFIDENETLWFVEPQTGQLAQTLEGWQGNDVRFFIGR